MGWPEVVIIVFVVIGAVALVSTLVAVRAGVRTEEAKGRYADQYRKLVADYEALAKETRDGQAAVGADLAELRKAVESIETMMREVA